MNIFVSCSGIFLINHFSEAMTAGVGSKNISHPSRFKALLFLKTGFRCLNRSSFSPWAFQKLSAPIPINYYFSGVIHVIVLLFQLFKLLRKKMQKSKVNCSHNILSWTSQKFDFFLISQKNDFIFIALPRKFAKIRFHPDVTLIFEKFVDNIVLKLLIMLL